MATTYFENMDFYRDLVSLSLSEEDQQRRPSPSLTAADEDVSDTTICARIRPLSVKEDGSSHISGIVVKDSSKAVLFEPRNKFNGTPDSTKHEFALDRVYNSDTHIEAIYGETAQELVPWIWAGGVSTLFAYGQTGSGKTFTVTGITNLVVKEMMAMAAVEHRELYVCCFEILGKKAYDLLDSRRVFSIMEDSFGTMQLVGVQEKCPSSEEEFLSILRTSSLLRTSASTSKNDQSSRSHAVHRIRAVNKSDPEKLDGELFLVDLAGSESSQDSKNHSAERLAETRDINTSLSILKDCIRGRTLWGLRQIQSTTGKGSTGKGSIHIPWRSSKLTQVLKHVFDTGGDRACKTVVVACVAPSIVDSAHSKNTLRYAEMLKIPVPKMKRQKDMSNPTGWTNELTKQWICENSGTPAINAEILAANLTGIQLCKLPQTEFLTRCLQTPGVSKEQAVAFYQKLWRSLIDSRQRASTLSNTTAAEIEEPARSTGTIPKKIPQIPFQQRIEPGMFVRVQRRFSQLPAGDILMILSPSRPEDFIVPTKEDAEVGKEDERKFVCAMVGPSVMTQAYELYVAQLTTRPVSHMEAEVLMEYDFATRYYYMDL